MYVLRIFYSRGVWDVKERIELKRKIYCDKSSKFLGNLTGIFSNLVEHVKKYRESVFFYDWQYYIWYDWQYYIWYGNT